jgi:UDP-N-acetylglucosamine--N-acetylmuramyl-(pentapeptide) pyrophosphoryl-undecaprenol N-acetylglucosamine transferase
VPTLLTGNPVRPPIAALAGIGYAPPAVEIRLLVLGGSLGARVFSEVVPPALALLPDALRARLHVTQQCRAEDLDGVRAAYTASDIEAELAPFFADVATLLRNAHLVIARAGASTIAELGVVGRPAILVPLPGAIDDHQTANARSLSDAGGAWMMPQTSCTQDALSGQIEKLISNPELLRAAAANAANCGHADAAARLADLVEMHVQESVP